ncbi:MAG: adenylate kinase [Nitrososphaerota archaeon]
MVRVIVLAVPGAGKTTIFKKLSELKPNVKILNFGDLMFKEASSRFGIKSRDEMRSKIPFDSYRELQDLAAESISREEGTLIVDTHAAIKTPYGYYPGLPFSVVTKMKPQSIIFLEYRPEDIAARRAKDEAAGVRTRGTESYEEIEEHQMIALNYAVAASNAASCYFCRFSFRYPEAYPYQHVHEAAEMIKKHIELLETMYNR